MEKHRDFNAIEESYLRDHPEEIDAYFSLILEAYAEDGNKEALLASLRVLTRVEGASKTAGVGSSFSDFLREQGTYEETTEQAVKRVIAYLKKKDQLLVEGLESGTSRPLEIATIREKGKNK